MKAVLSSVVLCAGFIAGSWNGVRADEGPGSAISSAASSGNSATAAAAPGAGAAGVALAPARDAANADPCLPGDVVSNPTRPNWDTSAQTTSCGLLEIDSGWMLQPMGGGVNQSMWMSSMRYGLTPKLDLRWGLTSHMSQSGGGTPALEGVGDQWLSARYRFVEQGRGLPAMALIYAAKVPTANPAKGFGTGFADNQFVFIASRDLGKNHFDFNIVGTEVGEAHGHDGSAQFGLALTRPATKKLSWILESYGGPQPGTSDRFGAEFAGASYVLRPNIVVDGAYARTYTAGSPRSQVICGFTYAMRPGFAPIPHSAMSLLLGR